MLNLHRSKLLIPQPIYNEIFGTKTTDANKENMTLQNRTVNNYIPKYKINTSIGKIRKEKYNDVETKNESI